MEPQSHDQGLSENQGTQVKRRVEGQRLGDRPAVVFAAQRTAPIPSKPGFAPFESFLDDDDLVYPVPESQPILLTLSSKFNKRPFLFNGFVAKAPATILIDSGATASFASLHWCQRHNITPKPMHFSGLLADQSTFNIVGCLERCSLKLREYRVIFQFLVADLPGLDIVLGLDFLEEHEPDLRWKQRLMRLKDPRPGIDNVYTIPAISRESLPEIHANLIELCSMQHFADMCANHEVSEEEVFVGFLRCSDNDSTSVEDEMLYAGKGADHPAVRKVLTEFSDVLVSILPPGDPPERLGPDGKRIEHTI
jgi:hypothetical protein